jgi:hypothetical protein
VSKREFPTFGELVGELAPIQVGASSNDPADLLGNSAGMPTVTAAWPWWGQMKLGDLPAVGVAIYDVSSA